VATLERIRTLMYSYARSCSPQGDLAGLERRVFFTVSPSIHQSRSRVLRFSAARTWVKTTSVTSAVLSHGLRSLCNAPSPCRTTKGPMAP
jgi:hypothetical protein